MFSREILPTHSSKKSPIHQSSLITYTVFATLKPQLTAENDGVSTTACKPPRRPLTSGRQPAQKKPSTDKRKTKTGQPPSNHPPHPPLGLFIGWTSWLPGTSSYLARWRPSHLTYFSLHYYGTLKSSHKRAADQRRIRRIYSHATQL